jgi:hypothetical protein
MRGKQRNNGFLHCLRYLCGMERLQQGDPGYWESRKKRGRPKALKSPQMLWDLACEYFQMVDSNPFKKQEVVKGGWLAGQIFEVETIRPYTWNGLENMLFERDIIADLDDYKANKKGDYSAYSEVIRVIGKIIFDQKFNGASVGAFDPRIIAMELGMSSKQELAVSVEQPLFQELPPGEAGPVIPANEPKVIDLTGTNN